jgi:transposase
MKVQCVLKQPAKLIRELRKRHSPVKARIIARTEKAKALRQQGLTQQAIADRLGVSQQQANRDLLKNNAYALKMSKQPRKEQRCSLFEHTQPTAVPERLRATLGDDRTLQVAVLLLEHVGEPLKARFGVDFFTELREALGLTGSWPPEPLAAGRPRKPRKEHPAR